MSLHVPPALRMRLRGTALARLYARAHAALYAMSGGRFGGAIHVATGTRPPVLLLATTGRRTGKTRTSPLLYLRDGGDLVVAASNAGHPNHPDWWLNRETLWRRFAAMYDGLETYQRQARRRFPVVVLTPDGARPS